MNQANVSSILSKNYLRPNDKSLTFEESLANKTTPSESLKEQTSQPHDSLIVQTREKNSHLMKKLAEATEEIDVFLKKKFH